MMEWVSVKGTAGPELETSMDNDGQAISYFDTNVRRTAVLKLEAADQQLLAAYLTIQDLAEVLNKPKMNIVDDLQEGFIVNVLLVDVQKVINSLRVYRGNIRKGVPQAKEAMDLVAKSLYKVQVAIRQNNADDKVNAIFECRSNLDQAQNQLEHWQEQANKIPAQDAAHEKPSAQRAAPKPPPGEQPDFGAATTGQNPP
jgi:flagellar biosynthesis chaperone FliJ